MTAFLIFMLLSGIALLILAIVMEANDYHPSSIPAFVGGLLFVVSVHSLCYDRAPTALHVYQGKTTLQVTYKDGVAIDSVVVFKDK